jgi:hypothetical protein
MGTLGGCPNPPAMVRAEPSSAAPQRLSSGTLGGFLKPPAVGSRRAKLGGSPRAFLARASSNGVRFMNRAG